MMPDDPNPYEPPETEGSQVETPPSSDADSSSSEMKVVVSILVVIVIIGLILSLG